ncbi:MAG: hypothetical protein Q8K24_08895 [Hydrogenophaga sp.]|nr:hypothetical protein [Hydrogenophaga sp.]
MKRTLVLDIELYSNYLLVMFKSIDTRRVMAFEAFPSGTFADPQALDAGRVSDPQALDVAGITRILREFRIVTFNGLDFDMPLLWMALSGRTVSEVKAAANHIIKGGLRGWQFEQHYQIKVPKWVDHIDLKESVPGVAISLKLYGGRLHSKRLQDLPIEPNAVILPERRAGLRTYCENDLDTTIDLWLKATDPKGDIIATRELMSAEFGIDLRSKSDAQIAEAAIKASVVKAKGEPVYRQDVTPGTTYRFKPMPWLQFNDPVLRAKFEQVLAAEFYVKADGKVQMPACLEGASVQLSTGGSVYRMGVGGLHSSESAAAHVATPDVLLRDTDVVSYYPSLILLCGLFPRNMGAHFQRVYRDFFDRRIHAKKVGHKSTAQTLKIVLNGTFGKLGSRYSVLYSPDLMLQVTVTGQLALLMLIERLEAAGIAVVSANTDGIVQKCPAHLDDVRRQIIARWERETCLETEDVGYRGLFSRDVNNYIALKEGGGVKTKGVFTPPGVMKNPDFDIIAEAVCAWLDRGTPIGETVIGCQDIRRFVCVQRVTGGAQMPTGTQVLDNWEWNKTAGAWEQWHGQRLLKEKRKGRPKPAVVTADAVYLGEVVRWYRSTRSTQHIEKVGNGNKVPSSDNAMPCMELPDTMPADVDYDWYIGEACRALRLIGAVT